MSDLADVACRAAPVESARDFDQDFDRLRVEGAADFDPVRWRHLEILAARVTAHEGRVRSILEARLAEALTLFRQRFEQAIATPNEMPNDALASVATQTQQPSGASAADTLAGLLRYIEQQSSTTIHGSPEAPVGARSELKALRYFRNTWSRLSVDQQVSQALQQPPEHAGPLNSHLLVLRSLAMMREIAPDYLNRFMSYADTLLCLDHDDRQRQSSGKKSAAGEGGKKPKGRRVGVRSSTSA